MASEIPTRAPNGFLVIVGSAAMLVVVAGVFIGMIGTTGSGGESLEHKRAAKRVEIRSQLEREAQEKLHSTGWVDKAKGTVHIPIDEAIVAVVAELKAKKPTVSQVKVEPPLPMPVVDPNSKEPAPPALPSAPQGADTIRFTYPYATPEAAATPAPPVPESAKPAAATPAPAKPAQPPPAAAAPAAPVVAPPAPSAPPAPATAPSPAAATPPAPAPPVQPAPIPATPPAVAPPAPAPPVNPAPAAAPEAPVRLPIINPTENSEPTK
jgi:hypothetical protein